MRLKRIELIGFKSFCERTVIHFEHPITGIVGPNGCGKSNVLDAIRWVMGEQSMKSLRGKERSDVIFAGSEKRKPSQSASVTLVLEDVAESLRPEGFKDESELAITRVLHADGESDYLLNGQGSRLRDIRMIFLGTGLGKHSYAILEQGRVNAFIQSTPEQRRLWIEEAAGISRYKEQRKQAETKMSQTEANLGQLSLAIQGLTQQRKNLQKQAAKARKHRQVKDEIQTIDLYLASHQFLERSAKQKQIQLLLDDLGFNETQLRDAIAAQERQVEELQIALRDEATALQKERETLNKKMSRVALLEQTIKHLQDDHKGLSNRHAQLQSEFARLTEQTYTDQGTLETLEAQQEEMQAEESSSSSKKTHLEARLSSLEAQLFEADARIEEIKRAVMQSVRQETTSRHQMQEMGRRRDELQGRIDQNQGEDGDLSDRMDEIEGRHSEASAVLTKYQGKQDEIAGRLEDLQSRYEAGRDQMEEAEVRTQQIQKQMANQRARLESLQEIQSQNQDLNEASRTLLEASQPNGPLPTGLIAGFVAEKLEASEESEAAVAAALGDRLHYLLVHRPEDAQKAIHYLQRRDAGRAGFFVIPRSAPPMLSTQLPKDPTLLGSLASMITVAPADKLTFAHLLHGYLLVQSLGDAIRLRSQIPDAYTLVTRGGDTVAASGEIVGGTAKASSLAMLQRNRQIRELTEEVAVLEGSLDAAIEQQERLQIQQEQIEIQQRSLREELQTVLLQHTRLSAEQESLALEILRSKERLAKIRSEGSRLQADLHDAATRHAEAQISLSTFAQQREAQEARLLEERRQIEADRQEQSQVSNDLTEVKIQIATRRERLEALSHQSEQIRRRRLFAHQRLAEVRDEIAQHTASLQTKVASLQEAQTELAAISGALGDNQTAVQTRDGRCTAIERQIQADLKQLEQRRSQIETFHASRTHHLLEQREGEVHLKTLDTEIRQKYGLAIGETLFGNHVRPLPTAKDHAELHALQQQLQKLGEINPFAEEEFAAVDKEFQFITEQIDDLEKTLASLRRTITRINNQTRQEFLHTYEIIREHFAKLFPKLFEGGSAELILTNPEDLLETGLEIMVRPPGKRRQTVALLSGGEKAMTTIALIFSFFLYKPTPFCVLDEVDAPLDDVNIDRYNAILRELCSISQFIVITHNKRTMEMADHLYGVTMQEPGISTTVAVRIEEAETLALDGPSESTTTHA